MQKQARPIRHMLTAIGIGAALLLWGVGLGVEAMLPDSSQAPEFRPGEIALGIAVSMLVLGGGGYIMGWVSDRIDGLLG